MGIRAVDRLGHRDGAVVSRLFERRLWIKPVAFGFTDAEPYYRFYPRNGADRGDEGEIADAIATGHPGIRVRFDNGQLCTFRPKHARIPA